MKIIAPFFVHTVTILISVFCLFLTSCEESTYAENKRLKSELNALSKELQTLREENSRFRELNGDPLQIGFEVQIGAFKEFDLEAYSDELIRLQEQKEFEYNKYILGQFSRYEDAVDFLEDVHNMGVKDAFIAGIVDGKRSSVAEAKIAAKKYYGNDRLSEFTSDWDEP